MNKKIKCFNIMVMGILLENVIALKIMSQIMQKL